MSYKETIIQNFTKCLEDNLLELMEKFLSDCNHENHNGSLEKAKNNILKETGILDNCYGENTPHIDSNDYLELRQKNLNIAWFNKIEEVLTKMPAEVVKSFFNEKKEEAQKLINDSYMPPSADEFIILKDLPEFKNSNTQLLHEVDTLCNGVYVQQEATSVISWLNAYLTTDPVIYRSFSTKNYEEFIKNLKGGEQTRGLGNSWSDKARKAQSYEGNYSHFHVKIHAHVDPQSIDYFQTLVKRLDFLYAVEQEFFIKSNEDVLVFHIEVFDKDGNKIEEESLPNPIALKT